MRISTLFLLRRGWAGIGRRGWSGGEGERSGGVGGGGCCSVSSDGAPTSALAVRPPQDPALLDLAEGGEHHTDLILAVLLGHHADEKLPVFHRCGARMEKGRGGESVDS